VTYNKPAKANLYKKIMKFFKSGLITLTLVSLFIISCERDLGIKGEDFPSNIVFGAKAKEENDFVWRALNSWYYWQDRVDYLRDDFRSSKDYVEFLNTKKTDELFYSLLYAFGHHDRNSWIMQDGNFVPQSKVLSNTMATTNTGFDYSAIRINNNTELVVLVNYVVPNTSAKNSGIKRGDVIIKINGQRVSPNNIRQLNASSVSITIAKNITRESNTIIYDEGETYNISSLENVKESPVHFVAAWPLNGRRVGYLVYNSFESGYNNQLNSVFKYFKSKNINELILDLRYNGGGSVATAVALGQMITGQFTGQDYVTLKFNEKHKEENMTMKMENQISVSGGKKEIINSLNLDRVFILTSGGTASASEIVIKCLAPYINVITIGGKTYGKYVGSTTLYDSPDDNFLNSEKRNKSHNWTLQPIVFEYFDKNETPNILNEGMNPTYVIDYPDYVGTVQDFDANSGNNGKPEGPYYRPSKITDPAMRKAFDIISNNNTQTFSSRIMYNKNSSDISFVASRKTLTPFGTDVYLESK